MKIYFAGSIRGGREDKNLYLQIIDCLSEYGKVLTEHVGAENLSDSGELNINDEYIHNRDINWLNESNIVIAEVTNPSLGVGYEIAKAIDMGKKVICFFRKSSGKALSAMISGAPDVRIIYYDDLSTLKKEIDLIFHKL